MITAGLSGVVAANAPGWGTGPPRVRRGHPRRPGSGGSSVPGAHSTCWSPCYGDMDGYRYMDGQRRSTVRDAVICEPLRTPVGGFGGSLRDVPVQDLASTVIRGLMERTGLPPESVDDVVLGHCYPTMEAPALGRVAALDAGLPVTATGLQIDRRCGSGLQAVLYAAMQVQNGVSDVVLAGGAESMSNAPFYSIAMPWGVPAGPGVLLNDGLARGRVTAGGIHPPVPGGMLETAENLRREYRISREEQ